MKNKYTVEKQECRRYGRDVDVNLCKSCKWVQRGQNSLAVIGCTFPKEQTELKFDEVQHEH